MRSFATHILHVVDGAILLSEPLLWHGRITERELEDFIVEQPRLAGEELLVLGRQLHEFQEDLDRLDVLAVDADGEIVLLELKVDGDFRVTDLQALAYAAAYANQDGPHLAETLRGYMARSEERAVPLDEAKEQIVDFLGIASFEDWEPSQHIRIKLIAPAFPRRVLATVKWLGDLYGMRIEAIQVRLYEGQPKSYQLSFDRVLPLPGVEEFDLTVRRREKKKRDENTSRRPGVVGFLLERGVLKDGQELWLDRNVLPLHLRELYDVHNPIFKVRVEAGNGAAKFGWHQSADEAEQLLSPSTVLFHVCTALSPGQDFAKYRSVHDKFLLSATGGETLGSSAEKLGWTGTPVDDDAA